MERLSDSFNEYSTDEGNKKFDAHIDDDENDGMSDNEQSLKDHTDDSRSQASMIGSTLSLNSAQSNKSTMISTRIVSDNRSHSRYLEKTNKGSSRRTDGNAMRFNREEDNEMDSSYKEYSKLMNKTTKQTDSKSHQFPLNSSYLRHENISPRKYYSPLQHHDLNVSADIHSPQSSRSQRQTFTPYSNHSESVELIAELSAFSQHLKQILINQQHVALLKLMSRLTHALQLIENNKVLFTQKGDMDSSLYLIQLAQALNTQLYWNVYELLHFAESLSVFQFHDKNGNGHSVFGLLVDNNNNNANSNYTEVRELFPCPESPTSSKYMSGIQLLEHTDQLLLQGRELLNKCVTTLTNSKQNVEVLQLNAIWKSPRKTCICCAMSPAKSYSPTKRLTSTRREISQLETIRKQVMSQLKQLSEVINIKQDEALFMNFNAVLSVPATLSLATTLLYTEGIPCIASLLLCIQSNELLQSIYNTWTDLTLKIPVSNTQLIAHAVPLELRSPVSLERMRICDKSVSKIANKATSNSCNSASKSNNRQSKGTFSCTDRSEQYVSPQKLTRSMLNNSRFHSANKSTDKITTATASTPLLFSRDNRSAIHNKSSRSKRHSYNTVTHTNMSEYEHDNDCKELNMEDTTPVDDCNITISKLASDILNVNNINFYSTQSLRSIGFTLLQLYESNCYSVSQLLSARFPIQELQLLCIPLTVPQLHTAGYSILQIQPLGYSLAELYCNGQGYNALELINSELYTISELQSVHCDIQRYALNELYLQLHGVQWKHSDNWGTPWPLNEWYGVVVNSDNQVIALNLNDNGLKGRIPAAISLLTSLKALDLQNNKLTSIPTNSIRKLVDLKELLLCGNNSTLVEKRSTLQSVLPTCHIRI